MAIAGPEPFVGAIVKRCQSGLDGGGMMDILRDILNFQDFSRRNKAESRKDHRERVDDLESSTASKQLGAITHQIDGEEDIGGNLFVERQLNSGHLLQVDQSEHLVPEGVLGNHNGFMKASLINILRIHSSAPVNNVSKLLLFLFSQIGV